MFLDTVWLPGVVAVLYLFEPHYRSSHLGASDGRLPALRIRNNPLQKLALLRPHRDALDPLRTRVVLQAEVPNGKKII